MPKSTKSAAFRRRSDAARRGWAQRGELVDHILTVEVHSKRRDGRWQRTSRDIIVPARPGTRKSDLIWLAKRHQDDLPTKERYAVDLLTKRYSERYTKRVDKTVTVAEGPSTTSRKVKLR